MSWLAARLSLTRVSLARNSVDCLKETETANVVPDAAREQRFEFCDFTSINILPKAGSAEKREQQAKKCRISDDLVRLLERKIGLVTYLGASNY